LIGVGIGEAFEELFKTKLLRLCSAAGFAIREKRYKAQGRAEHS
jgi:hypothetical protein